MIIDIINTYLVAVLVCSLIYCAIFTFACYKIVQNKGYPSNTCIHNAIGGFFLSWIWLIVVLCKPAVSQTAASNVQAEQQNVTPSAQNGGMSLGVFVATTLPGVLVTIAGLVILANWSWWGLALAVVGLLELLVVYNKV